MEEKCKYKNFKKSLIKALIFAATVLLLLAGEAGALTSSCASLANVQAWNGSISFTYSNSGSKSICDGCTIEWNIQQSADARFKLEGGYIVTGTTKTYSLVLDPAGAANINNMVNNNVVNQISTITVQGSGSPTQIETNLDVDLTACKYKFAFNPIVNAVTMYTPGSSWSGSVSVGQVKSGLYPIPITSSTLSGSANFPVYSVLVTPLTDMDEYTPGGDGGDVPPLYASNPGSASVTWEFRPILTGGLPVTNGIITGNVTNASSGIPITGATVAAGSITATTDTHGNYAISIVPGVYTVTASALGYRSSNAGVTVPPGATVIQNFGLQPGSANYDLDGDGRIQRNEAVNAIVDYFNGVITKQEAVGILMAYFSQ